MIIELNIFLISLINHADSKTNISFRFGSNPRDSCSTSVSHCLPISNILINSTCFNIKLPYDYTMAYNNEILKLERWSPLMAIPKCWTYLQTLLCTLKYPECSRRNSEWFINRPTQEICKLVRQECRLLIVENNNDNLNQSDIGKTELTNLNSLVESTPSFLDCSTYPTNCHGGKRLVVNTDLISCQWPMVNTVESTLWIKGFAGCSFYCKTPFFSKDDFSLTKSIFGVLGLMFFIFNLFVLITFSLHQYQHTHYKWHPMLLNLFIIHFYMLIASIGWMMQLIPSIGHSIICRNDGALQIRKPQVRLGESIWCVVVFSMIYFSLFASSLTSLSFFYSIFSVISQYSKCWTKNHNANAQENVNDFTSSSKLPFLSNKLRFSLRKADKNLFNFPSSQMSDLRKIDKVGVKFSGLGTNCDSINARNHSLSRQLFVVLISVSLLIISITMGEIKGDPISGICFISNDSVAVRISLTLLPLTVILIVMSIIMNITIGHIRVIQKHLNLYAGNQQKIHSNRMSKTNTFYVFILLFLWLFWCFSVFTHVYIFNNEKLWHQALKLQSLCKLKQLLSPMSMLDKDSESLMCPLETRPSINIFILHNFSYFSINIIFLFSAIFNKHSIIVWKLLFQKIFSIKNSEIHSSNNENSNQSNSITEKLYFGLQNRSLLDSIWNPGIFVYLIYKDDKTSVKDRHNQSVIEDKTATFGSAENSSASNCLYQYDGSLRSCVSMPPINVVGPPNKCHCSQNPLHESDNCPTLENFLKGAHMFMGQNSFRRSNSYAGRPFLVTSSPVGNISIPNSCYHSGIVNQHNSYFKDSNQNNSLTRNSIRNGSCFQNINKDLIDKQHRQKLNSCNSMNHLINRRNTLDNTSSKYNKSVRRFSMNFDRKKEKGVSSKSTLNRRKRAARYSVSPKSINKTFNNRSGTNSHFGDPSSRNSSSFSAESYNSYNLMSQQIGGRWRDICRTRMTLHDVMLWAKAASKNGVPIHSFCHNPLCDYSLPMDGCHYSNCSTGNKPMCQTKQCSVNIPQSMMYQNPNLTMNTFKVDEKFQKDYNPEESKKQKDIIQLTVPTINSEVSVDSNDSSDKFNSEDEIVSTENSIKNADRESGEFCSDDEIISLINEENQ